MEPLDINKTASTPKVIFDSDTHTLSLIGRSFPENAKDFYSPIIQWLHNNKNEFSSEIIVEINLEYYNTASSKFILEILHILEKIAVELHTSIQIKWFYMEDDEDMKEAGEEFKQFIHLPFECIETE